MRAYVADLAEAEGEIRAAIAEAIGRAIARNEGIPEPVDRSACRGNIQYRTTPERHYALLKEVERRKALNQGGSLSRVIDELVDDALMAPEPRNKRGRSPKGRR